MITYHIYAEAGIKEPIKGMEFIGKNGIYFVYRSLESYTMKLANELKIYISYKDNVANATILPDRG